ncbi:hypothetical protein BDQ17DRAFT_212961 [Cyathus striatus]|nr:hypothetical protein BDQ17DRAFT_212961 [Cyathus striatus]
MESIAYTPFISSNCNRVNKDVTATDIYNLVNTSDIHKYNILRLSRHSLSHSSLCILTPMTSNGLKGYSEFFTSGFRAVVSRMRRRQSSSVASSPAWLDSGDELSELSFKTFNVHLDKKHRRARTASLIVTPSSFQSRESKHARRSSLVSTLSTRLFDRIVPSPTPSPEKSGWTSSKSGSSRSSRVVEATDPEIADVCIATGGPYTPMATGESSEYVLVSRSLDPFSSSPDSSSKRYFIDVMNTPPPSFTPKDESFLSLSESDPEQSFLSLPQFPRRERPVSIQTMPLPSRSRRSSFQYRRTSIEKWEESSWILEEEDSPQDPVPSADHPHDPNDLANIDWRQFHIDLLLDD